MKYLLLFLLAIQTSFAKPLFSSHCEDKIIELINNSQKNINVAVYSISNDNIIEALIQAKQRNVEITILTDKIQVSNQKTFTKLEKLVASKINFKVNSVCNIMHDKFAIFDNKHAIAGSFNWTNPASKKNAEDCKPTKSKVDIKTYQARFQELWKINSQKYSDCFLKNIRKPRLACKHL
jgi:phosphatidylserine/phosphatidylglycerophosphate/cardiolipin synthase-like enzyme